MGIIQVLVLKHFIGKEIKDRLCEAAIKALLEKLGYDTDPNHIYDDDEEYFRDHVIID